MLAGGAPLRFGTRTVLDTNFLSELPRLCESKDFQGRERLEETLEFIDANRTDAGVDLCKPRKYERVVKANNPWPYRKVARRNSSMRPQRHFEHKPVMLRCWISTSRKPKLNGVPGSAAPMCGTRWTEETYSMQSS